MLGAKGAKLIAMVLVAFRLFDGASAQAQVRNSSSGEPRAQKDEGNSPRLPTTATRKLRTPTALPTHVGDSGSTGAGTYNGTNINPNSSAGDSDTAGDDPNDPNIAGNSDKAGDDPNSPEYVGGDLPGLLITWLLVAVVIIFACVCLTSCYFFFREKQVM